MSCNAGRISVSDQLHHSSILLALHILSEASTGRCLHDDICCTVSALQQRQRSRALLLVDAGGHAQQRHETPLQPHTQIQVDAIGGNVVLAYRTKHNNQFARKARDTSSRGLASL